MDRALDLTFHGESVERSPAVEGGPYLLYADDPGLGVDLRRCDVSREGEAGAVPARAPLNVSPRFPVENEPVCGQGARVLHRLVERLEEAHPMVGSSIASMRSRATLRPVSARPRSWLAAWTSRSRIDPAA